MFVQFCHTSLKISEDILKRNGYENAQQVTVEQAVALLWEIQIECDTWSAAKQKRDAGLMTEKEFSKFPLS